MTRDSMPLANIPSSADLTSTTVTSGSLQLRAPIRRSSRSTTHPPLWAGGPVCTEGAFLDEVVEVEMRTLIAVEAVDFRKGIDSLARLFQEQLNADPFSGTLEPFRRASGLPEGWLLHLGEDLRLPQR
jgi:IS66 Orf2 like protein